MTADKGSEFVRVRRDALQRARDTAMEWTVRGRIPECGEFGGIAQDLDAMLSAAPPAESQPQGISGDLERFDFVDPALVVPWLAVIYSEFLPDEDNLGRRSDIEMRAALDYAMKFVAGHRKCQPDWFQKQALEAYSLLAAEGWAWDAPHGWTRPPIAAPDHIADARKMVAAPGNVEPLPRATVKLVVSLLRHRRDSLSNDAAAWLERFAALRSQEPAYGPDGSMSIHYQQDGCQMYKHPPECWSQGQAVAVGDAMVERACRAYFPGWETFHPEAWKAPRRLGMRAAITAALAQQANKEQPPNA